MMQFPLGLMQSGSAAKSLSGGNGPEGPIGLDFGSMLGGDLELSEEMVNMLMQLPPEMLASLQQHMASGMSLPQAAQSVLARHGESLPLGLQDMALDTELVLEPDLELKDIGLNIKNGLARQLDGDAVRQRLIQAENLAPEKVLKNLVDAAGNALDQSAEHSAGRAVGNITPLTTNSAQASGFSSTLNSNLLGMGVPQRVGTPEWNSAVGDRMVWMLKGGVASASMRLNPPEMGPLEIKISIDNDQANVSFVAQNAGAREALEQALPRLREMLEANNIQLADVDVKQRDAQQGDTEQGEKGQANTNMAANSEGDDATGTVISSAVTGVGLVDLFA